MPVDARRSEREGPGAPPWWGGAPGLSFSYAQARRAGIVALAAVAAVAALATQTGCASGSPRATAAGSAVAEVAAARCPSCALAERTNGWCDRCARGFVAGRAIPSRLFHDALDAHGHDLGSGGVLCLECAEALEVDGFCTRCRAGFVAGQLYYSELTWSLHRGTMRAREEIRCKGCLEAYGGTGECAECGARWVGSVEFRDPALHAIHARAAHQFQRLELALERVATCEMCAAAGFFGRNCPRCGTAPVPE